MNGKRIFALAAVLTLACAAGAAARGVMPQDEFLACCARGKLSQVGKGVRRNADVNRLEATGQSPLICAAGEQDDPRVIEYLVKKGAEVNKANFQGLTPLMVAALRNPRARIARALLKCGADPRLTDMTGSTALILAARGNPSAAVLSALIEAAPDTLNRASASGVTALMAAAESGRAEIIDLLLKKGADLRPKDASGRRAVDYARANPALCGSPWLDRLDRYH